MVPKPNTRNIYHKQMKNGVNFMMMNVPKKGLKELGAHRRVEGVGVHVAGDALDEVLDRHRRAEVGAVAGALVCRVIHQGAAVGQLKGD